MHVCIAARTSRIPWSHWKGRDQRPCPSWCQTPASPSTAPPRDRSGRVRVWKYVFVYKCTVCLKNLILTLAKLPIVVPLKSWRCHDAGAGACMVVVVPAARRARRNLFPLSVRYHLLGTRIPHQMQQNRPRTAYDYIYICIWVHGLTFSHWTPPCRALRMIVRFLFGIHPPMASSAHVDSLLIIRLLSLTDSEPPFRRLIVVYK